MLKLADARRIIDAAEKKAIEIGQPMNIAVVDEGANLISHIRMDNAWIGSINIAINKAFTSRAFNISTKELAENSQPGDQFYGIHVSNHDRVMIFAGGIPLKDFKGRGHRRDRRIGRQRRPGSVRRRSGSKRPHLLSIEVANVRHCVRTAAGRAIALTRRMLLGSLPETISSSDLDFRKSMATERYNAPDRERYWQHVWEKSQIFRASEDKNSARNAMCSRCSRIRRGASTWGMCAITRWATSLPVTNAPRVSTSCIRWDGTRSACRPRTPRWNARSIPARGPMPTSRRCAAS